MNKIWETETNNYLATWTTQEISYTFDVKGAAIEASASERDIPTSAVLSAPQSFAPSPHIPQVGFQGSF